MPQPEANRVDLDDSSVVAVSRTPGRIVIKLEQKRNNKAQHIEVRVTEVSREIAEYYVGHEVTAPHPSPELPLDYIEYAELGPNHVELQGYLKNDSWYVWRIEGNGIQIMVER
jgi:hypothetical protein